MTEVDVLRFYLEVSDIFFIPLPIVSLFWHFRSFYVCTILILKLIEILRHKVSHFIITCIIRSTYKFSFFLNWWISNSIEFKWRCLNTVSIRYKSILVSSLSTHIVLISTIYSPPLVPKIEGTVHKGSRRFRQRVHNGRNVVFWFRC